MRQAFCWLMGGLLLMGPGPADEPPPGNAAAPGETEADEAAGKPTLVLDAAGHTAPIHKVLFTRDGKQVITVSRDKTIRVWSTESGAPLQVLRPAIGPGGAGELLAGALSPDGKVLAVAGWGFREDGKRVIGIHLITLATQTMRTLRGHTAPILTLAFSADGQRLASGGRDKTACVWDMTSGKCLLTLQGHTDAIYDVAFSPNRRRLVTASGDGTGRIWSLETGKTEAVLKGTATKLFAVAWSPDGRSIVTGGRDHEGLRVWNANGKRRKTLPLDSRETTVVELLFKPESRARGHADLLATWRHFDDKGKNFEYGTTFVNLATGERQQGMHTHKGTSAAPMSTALSATLGATCGGDDHAVWLWALDNHKVVYRLAGPGRAAFSAAWSRDGKAVAWGVPKHPGDHAPRLQAGFRLNDLLMFHRPTAQEFRGAWTSRGTLTATKVSERVLQIKEGSKVLATIREPHYIDAYTFLPDDRIAVAVELSVHVYNARTGQHVHKCLSHRGRIWALAPSPDGKYLLSASADETIRITPAQAKGPLLTLFTVGSEWIAWTPEGYYAASGGGERLMGWQIGGGAASLASFYPAARFRKTLYRPDVIEQLLTQGSLEKALTAANRAKGVMQTQVVEVAEVLPPDVVIAAPQVKDSKLTEPALKIEATARGKGTHAVTSLQLLLDGRPYPGGQGFCKVEGAKPQAEVKHTWQVELPEGEHILRVVARSAASMGLSNDLELTYVKPVPKAKLFLLAIGIDKYAAPGLKLNCAVNDATELAETMAKKSDALFEVQRKVLTNQQATRDGILAGLKWLKEGMKAQDLAIIFYAGHGEKDGKGHFFLLPQEADVGRLADTSISGDKLKEHLADLPGRVVLLLDACHSGAIGKVINDLARDLADDDCGVVVFCAALGSEKAGEKDRHGYFCQALLEVLKGENNAPRNPRDGCVYLHHVEQYVIDRVQDLSTDEQHPTAAQPALRPLALAKP